MIKNQSNYYQMRLKMSAPIIFSSVNTIQKTSHIVDHIRCGDSKLVCNGRNWTTVPKPPGVVLGEVLLNCVIRPSIDGVSNLSNYAWSLIKSGFSALDSVVPKINFLTVVGGAEVPSQIKSLEQFKSGFIKEFFPIMQVRNQLDITYFDLLCSLSRDIANELKGNDIAACVAGVIYAEIRNQVTDPYNLNCIFNETSVRKLIIDSHLTDEISSSALLTVPAFKSEFCEVDNKATIESICVMDAVNILRTGAFYIISRSYGWGSYTVEHSNHATSCNYTINEYVIETLFRNPILQPKIKTKTRFAREIVESANKFRMDFIEQIFNELNSENKKKSTDYIDIINVFYRAGACGKAPYNSEDPFAEHGRQLNPEKFALDELLISTKFHMRNFIVQLRYELNGFQHKK